MYKDKVKENEAAKERMRRYRERKGVTESVTPKAELVTPSVTPLSYAHVTPEFIVGMKNWTGMRKVRYVKPVSSEVKLEHWRDGMKMVDGNLTAKCKEGCPRCYQKIQEQFERDNQLEVNE